MPPSIQSMGASAQLNTAWNITNMTATSTSSPHTGCSSTASKRANQWLSCGARVTHGREHAAQVGLGLFGVFGRGVLPRRRGDAAMAFPTRRLNRFDERIGAAAFYGDGRQHRHAELGGQARHVDMHAAALRRHPCD